MIVEMGKKYTSNGKPIRILCVDRPDPIFTVVGMNDKGIIFYFTKDGRVCLSGPTYDLVEVWEPKEGELCIFFDNKHKNTAVHIGNMQE
jgi:hypothetical protein